MAEWRRQLDEITSSVQVVQTVEGFLLLVPSADGMIVFREELPIGMRGNQINYVKLTEEN